MTITGLISSKTSDFKIASKTWVFSDEHPDSINDGIQYTPTSDGEDDEWGDLPASYHVGACGYAFADGHSEIHKWMNPKTDSCHCRQRQLAASCRHRL
jgi:prepilin-type processing-associated H-X9-DG protein